MPSTLDDVYETRRENLSRLLREPGAKTQLATRLGASQAHITHLLKPPSAKSARAIREETARQIESIMGLAEGALDHQVDAPPGHAAARSTHITVAALRTATQSPRSDPQLLEQSFKVVIDTLMERQVRVPSEKAAKMARLVYDQALVTGAVDPALVTSLIGLMS